MVENEIQHPVFLRSLTYLLISSKVMEWIKIGKYLGENKLIDFYINVFRERAIQK